MTEIYETLADAVVHGPYAPFLVNQKQLGLTPAYMAELDYPGGTRSFTSRPEFSLTRTVQIDRPGRIENEFGRRNYRRYRPRDMELAVPGTSGTWSTEGRTNLIMLALPRAKLAAIMEDQGTTFDGDFGVLHQQTFRSDPIVALFDQLWQVTRPGCPVSALMVDGLLMALVAHLLYLSKKDGAMRTPDPHALSQDVMARLDTYMLENPSMDLQITDLARLAGMSITAFARALKHTNGYTPYQFVMQKRLKVAQRQIRTTSDSLAQIAFVCGFSSQSHMTDVFRAKLGVTPGQLRKA